MAPTWTVNGLPDAALVGACTNVNLHVPWTLVDGLVPSGEKPPPTDEPQAPPDEPHGALITSVTASEEPGAPAGEMPVMVTDPAGSALTAPLAPFNRVAELIVKPGGAVRVTEVNGAVLESALVNVAISVGVVPANTVVEDTARL